LASTTENRAPALRQAATTALVPYADYAEVRVMPMSTSGRLVLAVIDPLRSA
jgi:hypothetical protein